MKSIVYERIKDRLNVSFGKFIDITSDWEFRPFYINGKLMCVVMIRGDSVHVITTNEYKGRGLSRTLFKEVLGEIFNKYGHIDTQVMSDHKSGIRLAEWLGFVKISEEGNILSYRMEQTNVWSQ